MDIQVYAFIEKLFFDSATAVDYSYAPCTVRCNVSPLPSIFPIFCAKRMAYHKCTDFRGQVKFLVSHIYYVQ